MRPEQGDPRDMPPRPFLRPAWEKAAPKVVRVFVDALRRALGRKVRR